MLPESSIVNTMFGFTGFNPWIGTSASVSTIAAACAASGCKAMVAARMAAKARVQAFERATIMAAPVALDATDTAIYFSTACA